MQWVHRASKQLVTYNILRLKMDEYGSVYNIFAEVFQGGHFPIFSVANGTKCVLAIWFHRKSIRANGTFNWIRPEGGVEREKVRKRKMRAREKEKKERERAYPISRDEENHTLMYRLGIVFCRPTCSINCIDCTIKIYVHRTQSQTCAASASAVRHINEPRQSQCYLYVRCCAYLIPEAIYVKLKMCSI